MTGDVPWGGLLSVHICVGWWLRPWVVVPQLWGLLQYNYWFLWYNNGVGRPRVVDPRVRVPSLRVRLSSDEGVRKWAADRGWSAAEAYRELIRLGWEQVQCSQPSGLIGVVGGVPAAPALPVVDPVGALSDAKELLDAMNGALTLDLGEGITAVAEKGDWVPQQGWQWRVHIIIDGETIRTAETIVEAME